MSFEKYADLIVEANTSKYYMDKLGYAFKDLEIGRAHV